MYNIMCRVSGGVTGTREALLKSNGKVQEFETKEEAERRAAELNQKMNHQNSTAFFSYRVLEYDPWN